MDRQTENDCAFWFVLQHARKESAGGKNLPSAILELSFEILLVKQKFRENRTKVDKTHNTANTQNGGKSYHFNGPLSAIIQCWYLHRYASDCSFSVLYWCHT